MPEPKRTAREIVELYIKYTSNEGNADWVPKLCADPVRRHDPESVTDMSHEQQMDRIRNSKLRPLGPFFSQEILHGEGPYVTWVWNMTLEKGDKRICGIEVFKVENGLITDVWNSSYMDGGWK